MKIGKFFKRALGGALKKPLKTLLIGGGLAMTGLLGAGAKAAATKLLGKAGAAKLLKGSAKKWLPWLVGAAALGGFERKKIRPETWTPQMLQPYLEPSSNPIVGALYQQLGSWLGYSPASIAATGAATTTDLGQFAALQATRPTDWQTVAISTAEMMRPLFEQQLQRQIQSLHEQLAAAAGTPSGGALVEGLTRFAGEMERGWMSQIADMALRELARQQEMAQRWASLAPELFRGALGIAAAPTEMALRIAEHLRPVYGGMPVYPYEMPSLIERLADPFAAWVRAGVIKI